MEIVRPTGRARPALAPRANRCEDPAVRNETLVAAALAVLAVVLASAPTRASAAATESLVPFRQGEKWGFADRGGRPVLAATFDHADRFLDGLARVERDGRWGYVDPAGREVVAIGWSFLGPFSEGLAAACADTGVPTGVSEGVGRQRRPVTVSACGFVDREGKVVVPLRYHGVNPVEQGVAQVRIGRASRCLVAAEWGLVARDGREILPVASCFVSPPSEGLVRVVHDEESLDVRRFGFYALDGTPVLPRLPYDGAHERWSEGRMGVRKGGRFGFIDRAGREVIPLEWDSARPFSEGLAAVERGGRWGFVDAAGKVVIEPAWDEVESFQQGLAWVVRDRRAGFVGRDGRVVVPLEFDGWVDRAARPFWSEGLRGMKAVDGGWGFVDRTGRWVIPPVHDFVRPCSEGLCAVQKGGLWGFVDLSGATAIPCRYQRLESTFAGGLAYVSRRLRADLPHFAEGWIDRTGREFFDEPPVF